MDSPNFSSDHKTAEEWTIAKNFFSELVRITQKKVTWYGASGSEIEGGNGLGGLDKEDRDAFEAWRRDAGEVIAGA